MKSVSTNKNQALYNAIEKSKFGSIARLADSIGISYSNVVSYVRRERSPIDRNGFVKYDASAIAEALNCPLEALFPRESAHRKLRADDADVRGKRSRKSVGKKRKATHVDLTDKRLRKLCDFRDKGYLPGAILKAALKPPAGLTVNLINGLFSERARTVSRLHLAFILRACRAMACNPKRRVPITLPMREALKEERRRTGIAQSELVAQSAPIAVSAGVISDWINGYSKSAVNAHYEAVLQAWKALPDSE
jgi:hypothetical protein